MKAKLFVSLLCLLVVSCHWDRNVNRNPPDLSATKKITVVAHRGDWRNAPENSIQAIENCIGMGVDMVEVDVSMTKDSAFVLMHDGTLDRTTNGTGKISEWTLDSLKMLFLKNGANHLTYHKIPTLEEALLVSKDRILLNLDKCYPYIDKIYEILKRTGTLDQAVLKGDVHCDTLRKHYGAYLEDIMFMPIIRLDQTDARNILDSYRFGYDPYGYEFIFSTDTSRILYELNKLTNADDKIWVNSLWASLNAGYEDEAALTRPDSIYGWLIDRGFNAIQTDRPAFLLEYLRRNDLHL